MPFNTASCLAAYRTRYQFRDPVRLCQLCHFSLEVSDVLLEWLIARSKQDTFLKTAPLEALRAMTREERLPELNRFWSALGIDSITQFDAHTRQGARLVDFNEEISEPDSFDWVENAGVTEHIFDQRAVFASMHNLCRVGGVLNHKIPMHGVLNITLYGISPRFLHDLAIANKYDILHLGIGNRWGDYIPVRENTDRPIDTFQNKLPFIPGCSRSLGWTGPDDQRFLSDEKTPVTCKLPAGLTQAEFMAKSPLQGAPTALGRACAVLTERALRFRPDNPGELYVIAAFRKASPQPFQPPFQGNNVKDIESPEMQARYRNQILYEKSQTSHRPSGS